MMFFQNKNSSCYTSLMSDLKFALDLWHQMTYDHFPESYMFFGELFSLKKMPVVVHKKVVARLWVVYGQFCTISPIFDSGQGITHILEKKEPIPVFYNITPLGDLRLPLQTVRWLTP